MTYDPYRSANAPREPYQDFQRDPDGGTGASFLLGALILLAVGGFLYYFVASSEMTVASNDIRPPITQSTPTTTPETTGSGATTPAPARPAQ